MIMRMVTQDRSETGDMMLKPTLQVVILAAVLSIIGVLAVFFQQPWLVPSLGSAVFVQVLTPTVPSARPYHISVGQLIGVLGGFTGVYAAQAVSTPIFTEQHTLVYVRVIAMIISVVVTAALQLTTKAISAAGGTIALLLALGLQAPTLQSLGELIAGILLVTILGEVGRKAIERVA